MPALRRVAPLLLSVLALALAGASGDDARASQGFVAHLGGEGLAEPAQVVCTPIGGGVDCAIARSHRYVVDCGPRRGDGIHFVLTGRSQRLRFGCAPVTGEREPLSVGDARLGCDVRRVGSGIGATTELVCRRGRRGFSVDVSWTYRRLGTPLVVRPCGDGQPGVHGVIAWSLTCPAAFELTAAYVGGEDCPVVRRYEDGAVIECRTSRGRVLFYAGG